MPNGSKVAITAAPWYRVSDGGYSNSSAGGTMLGGESTPNDGDFRTYPVNGGSVTATYSSVNKFVDTGNTSPAIVSVLAATPAANRIGTRPFASATVMLAGLDSATWLAPATVAPGATVNITLANIRDALGNLVPDGTRLALTARRWYNRDGSYHNGSAGGALPDGASVPNDGDFRAYVVAGGAITFAFTAPTTANVTSVIAVTAADGANNRLNIRPFVALAIRVQ